MASISRDIHIDASPQQVREAWDPFIENMLTGPMRLACDELACTDAIRSGLLTVTPAAEGGTSVVVRLESGDAPGPADETIGQRIMRDLILFKDFVEAGGGSTRPVRKAEAEEDTRREHKPPGLHPVHADDDKATFAKHFPN
jgi:hypothetical protein